jgi:hypothetical protein
MKSISIYKDFKLDDLASGTIVETIVGDLNFGEDNIIEVDLRDCFIDYPYTSRLMDKAFSHLSKCSGFKAITIKYDLNAKESTLLNWLFLESDFFDLKNHEKSLEIDIIKKKVEEKLKANQIKMTLLIQYQEGADILNSYVYE